MLIHYLTSPLVAIHNRSLALIAWVFFAVMVCSYIWFCGISSYSIAIYCDYRVLQLWELVVLGLEIANYVFRSIKVFYQGKPLLEAQRYQNSFIWFVGFGWTIRYKFTLINYHQKILWLLQHPAKVMNTYASAYVVLDTLP